MAEHETLWGRDIDETPADLENDHVSNGHHDPITEPIPVVEADYEVHDSPETEPYGYADELSGFPEEQSEYFDEQSRRPEEIGKAFSYADPFIDPRRGFPAS